MKKILSSAIVLALASAATAVNATDLNIRTEFNPEHGSATNGDGTLKNPAQYLYRLAVNHRFENGVGFTVETKLQSDPDSSFLQDITTAGSQANVSYRWKFADDFTLTPQLKYETNADTKLTRQANLTLGYRVTKELSTSVRYRYNYDTWTDRERSEHYNQLSFGAGYKGLPYVDLSASVDYRVKRSRIEKGAEKNTVDEDNKGIAEMNFKVSYTELGDWAPFVEVGAVSGYKDNSKVKDSYVPRYRVGVSYKF